MPLLRQHIACMSKWLLSYFVIFCLLFILLWCPGQWAMDIQTNQRLQNFKVMSYVCKHYFQWFFLLELLRWNNVDCTVHGADNIWKKKPFEQWKPLEQSAQHHLIAERTEFFLNKKGELWWKDGINHHKGDICSRKMAKTHLLFVCAYGKSAQRWTALALQTLWFSLSRTLVQSLPLFLALGAQINHEFTGTAFANRFSSGGLLLLLLLPSNKKNHKQRTRTKVFAIKANCTPFSPWLTAEIPIHL